MSTLEQPKLDPLQAHRAAERGLASLLLGGFLAVMAILMLQINLQMFLGPKTWALVDINTARYAASAGGIVLFVMSSASIVLGLGSLSTAKKYAQSSALGWAGLLISIFAMLLWIGTLVDFFSVLDMLSRSTATQVLDSLQRAIQGTKP